MTENLTGICSLSSKTVTGPGSVKQAVSGQRLQASNTTLSSFTLENAGMLFVSLCAVLSEAQQEASASNGVSLYLHMANMTA